MCWGVMNSVVVKIMKVLSYYCLLLVFFILIKEITVFVLRQSIFLYTLLYFSINCYLFKGIFLYNMKNFKYL